MQKRSLAVSVCFLCVTTALGFGREAKVYTIKLDNAAEIQSDSDHLNIVFVSGWISDKDTFFKRLLSRKSKTAAAIDATGTYFDGEQLKNSWVVENSDVGGNLDRPWGVANRTLLSDIPADTLNPNITVKFAIHQEDRIKQILGVFQNAEPTVGATVQPYLTYATMVDGFFAAAFGTDKTKYPFLMDTGLSDQNVKSPLGMYEHYLIGIAPNKDGDEWLRSLDGSKLAYEASTKLLTYNSQPVTDHTYAVFLIQRAVRPNIPSLLFESNAPWAVLGLGTFYQSPLAKIEKKEDIVGVEIQYIKNLSDCVGLLKRELRFSAFDRASAMGTFAGRSEELVAASCKQGNVPVADCETPQLDAYRAGITDLFKLQSFASREAALRQSKSWKVQIEERLKFNATVTTKIERKE
jgi:hypothetical protein